MSLRRIEWVVRPFGPQAEAVAFLREHHYARGASKASLYRHGLYRREEEPLGRLMGVALWLPPLPGVGRTVGEEGAVLVLSRLCVHPDAPKNAAGFLLAHSMRLIDRDRWPTLLTYADTSLGHTGAIYKATGWSLVGESRLSGNVWVDADGVQRGRKRGDGWIKHEQMRALGYTQRPALPKLKFVHLRNACGQQQEGAA